MTTPGVIEKERVDRCELCGAVAETRPYGPNGEEVCFHCGMKDEAAAKRGFNRLINGEPIRRNRSRKKERGK